MQARPWITRAAADPTLKWAARSDHLGGVPRKLVIAAVGAFAKAVTAFLNSTHVQSPETLIRLVRSRPQGQPLITVSNHMSTMDDPLIWGFKGFPTGNAKLQRWVLAAEDICFKNIVLSYLFRLGKCIPITRGGGIYQEHMNEALDVLKRGGWVMPETSFIGRRPPFPLCNKDIKIIIGELIQFDLQTLKQKAMTMSQATPFPRLNWPDSSPDGLNEAQQRWLYTKISDAIWTSMERWRCFGSSLKKV